MTHPARTDKRFEVGCLSICTMKALHPEDYAFYSTKSSGAISPNAAARTKLKKIFSDERKKKELAEADAIANRSPHKKEVCDRNLGRMLLTQPQYSLLSHTIIMAWTF